MNIMTDQEQIIALAELDGRKYLGTSGLEWVCGYDGGRIIPGPHYLEDLNTAHELALKVFNGRTGHKYCGALRLIVVRDATSEMASDDSGLTSDLYFYEATARQRCEAILRATGRFK